MGNATTYGAINRTSIGDMDSTSISSQTRTALRQVRKVRELERQLSKAKLELDRMEQTMPLHSKSQYQKLKGRV